MAQKVIRIKTKQKEQAKIKDFQITKEQIKEYKNIFKYLNNKDLDILYLMFVSNKRQLEVRELLRRTQPSLSYDIRRIRDRLTYICYMNGKIDEFLDILLNNDNYTGEERDLLICMYFTTSLTACGKVLNQRQSKTRYIFDRLLKRMKENKEWNLYEIFYYIRHNLNIMKRFYDK